MTSLKLPPPFLATALPLIQSESNDAVYEIEEIQQSEDQLFIPGNRFVRFWGSKVNGRKNRSQKMFEDDQDLLTKSANLQQQRKLCSCMGSDFLRETLAA